MFDDKPTNLPLEPGKAPPPQPPTAPVPSAPAEPGTSRPPSRSAQSSVPAGMQKPAGGPKEPEDIFAGVDEEEKSHEPQVEAEQAPKRRGSMGKVLGIVFLIIVLVVIAAGALWYFLIREKPLPTFEAEQVPTIIETPPALPPETTPPPALPPPEAISPEEEAPLPEPEAPVIPESAAVPAPDTDNDGLTNPEESVFGTSIVLADSDQDSFGDGAEVQNGYDPAVEGARLEDSGRFRFIEFNRLWRVLLPAAWTVLSDSIIPGDIVVETDSANVIRVHLDQKPETMPFADWLASNEPTVEPGSLQAFTSKAGIDGWRSADGRTVYLTAGSKVLVMRYQTGGSGSVDYPAIFDHIQQTIKDVQ